MLVSEGIVWRHVRPDKCRHPACRHQVKLSADPAHSANYVNPDIVGARAQSAVRITRTPPDGANVIPRRTTRTDWRGSNRRATRDNTRDSTIFIS